jgi:ELWxxDGT repeat protein
MKGVVVVPPRRLAGLLPLAIFACSACFGSTPHVININQQSIGVSSNPTYLGTLAGWTYFAANDAVHGVELWKTDGTTANTTLVKDINPGVSSSSPARFFVVGNVAYFAATSGDSGNELWVTDGTTNGTRLVMDINPGTQPANPAVLGVLSGKVLFAVYAGAYYELWITDGTQAGTVRLGLNGNDGTWPYGFTVASNDKAYYIGFNPVYGAEPWVSDGTPGGTHRLPDGAPNTPIANPSGFVQVGNYVYFKGVVDGNVGAELWRIRLSDDGLEKVTSNLNVIGAEFTTGPDFNVLGNVLVFPAESSGVKQVWRSDGTPAGTYALSPYNIQYGTSQINPAFSVINGRVVYVTNADSLGPVFFSTDGTVAGTVRLFDNPMSAPATHRAGIAANLAFFVGDAGLFSTDGTRAGTKTVQPPADFRPYFPGLPAENSGMAGDANVAYFFSSGLDVSLGVGGYAAMRYDVASNALVTIRRFRSPLSQLFALAQGKLLFSPWSDTAGYEPWISDGTSAGTRLIADIAAEPTELGSLPSGMMLLNGHVYFAADDGVAGREIWQTDGTTAGTHLAADVLPGAAGSNPQGLFTLGGSLMFFGSEGSSVTPLWRYDPATQALQKISGSLAAFPSPFSVATVQGVAYFPADDGGDVELWRTDGTLAGTKRVADLLPGFGSSNPRLLTSFGNKVFFFASELPGAGYGFWSSDGTEAGTVRLALQGSSLVPPFMVSVGGALYYLAADSSGVRSLWRSDGTAAGTTVVAPFPDFVSYQGLLNGKLLFAANTNELRTFDPASGTFAVLTAALTFLEAGPVSADGKRAYFGARDATHAFGPWVTDGTVAGTKPIADVATGNTLRPNWIGDFNGVEIFVADEYQGGNPTPTRRYWRSDGTSAGTVVIGPLSAAQSLGLDPLGATPTPRSITVGDRFLFSVLDPAQGTEPYVLENDAPVTGADSATANFGESVSIDVLTNDSDPDGALDPSQVAIVTGPQHGIATAGADGRITYAPASGYSGADSFAYSVRDKQGRASASTTVSVTVAAAPSGAGGSGGGSGGSGSSGGTGGGSGGSSGGSGGSGSDASSGGGGALDWSALILLALVLGLSRASIVTRLRAGISVRARPYGA